MKVKSILLSSLDKVFPDEAPTVVPWTEMSALRGEIASFQWTFSPDEGNRLEAVDVDMDAIIASLCNGTQSLPCLLVEVDEPGKNQHIKITLE